MKFLIKYSGKRNKKLLFCQRGRFGAVRRCLAGMVWAGLGTAAGTAGTPRALPAGLGLLQWHRGPELGHERHDNWDSCSHGDAVSGLNPQQEDSDGLSGHPFSTADFCESLSDVPKGNWGTVKTVVSHWLYLAESNSWACCVSTFVDC